MTADLHVNDVGTVLRFTIKEAGVPLDLASVTSKKLKLEKKDKTTLYKDLSFTTSGSDGKVEYITAAGDLDQKGKLRAQVYLESSDGKWHTSIVEWEVEANIATPV